MKRLSSLSLNTKTEFVDAPEAEFNANPYKAGPFEVLPGLFLGDEVVAMNQTLLQMLSIRTVINVAKEVDLPMTPSTPQNTGQAPLVPIPNDVRRANLISPESDIQEFDRLVQMEISRFKFAWTHDQDLQFGIDDAIDLIQKRIREGPVLVHCQQGVSRSVALIIALVMRNRSLKCFQAYEIVKSTCPHISPNVNLISQLIAMEPKWNL